MAGRSAETRTLRRTSVGIGIALAIGWGFAGLACDGQSGSAPPSALCREAGAQCQLPEGPLGVCERAACEAGQTTPCFRCIPQH